MRATLECLVPKSLLAMLALSKHTGPEGLQPSSSRITGVGLAEESPCDGVRSGNECLIPYPAEGFS